MARSPLVAALLEEHAEGIDEARWNMANDNGTNISAALVALVDALIHDA